MSARGALLSVGDLHFAQGDGEACGTAIEIAGAVTLRVRILRGAGAGLNGPVYETPPRSPRRCLATTGTGIAPDGGTGDMDLMLAARNALSALVDLLETRCGFERPAAYVLASLPATLSTTASAMSGPRESSAPTSMLSPKTKKKSAAKMSRKLRNRSSISCRADVSESTTPAISAPIASERPRTWAVALIPIRSANVKRRKNSRGIHSSSRWIVIASCPVASSSRRAARPVGAQRAIVAFAASASATISRVQTVLPTPGPPVRTEIREANHLILRIRERGTTVLLTEHHMSLVMEVSDCITVLNYGRKIAEGRPEAVKRDPEVLAAYLGAEA